MNRTIKKIAMAAALTLPIALIGQAAQAALITQWQYDVETGYQSFTDSSGTGTGVVGENPNPNLGNLPTTLSWGPASPAPRSSIVISGSVTGNNLHTNGAAVDGATFTHNNFVIPNTSSYLTSASILNQVTLTPFMPPGPGLTPFTTTFAINFQETRNDAGTCPPSSTSVCDDIFVLTNPGAQSFSFPLNGTTYTVALDIMGLTTLSDEACSRAGAASGCQGVLTQEDRSNVITTQFSITAQNAPVPEPGTLSIMGLGLVGLALMGIRRNRKKS